MSITSTKKTAIIEERVTTMLGRVQERAARINEDGALPGDIMRPGPERYQRYVQLIDIADYALLMEPNWELWIRTGLDPGPVSPYLINLLRVPGLLKEVGQDFTRLNQRYVEGEDAVAPSSEQRPEPAGGGISMAETATAGPPQPEAGGGAGSAGGY